MYLLNLVTPIFGKYLHVGGGARVFLLVGSFIVTLGNISFGFLNGVNSSTTFLSMSIVLRVVTAIGEGAIQASAYTLAAKQGVKENEGKLNAIAEACFGVGTTIGPSLGGLLFEVGGFPLPFWVTGGILLMITLASCFFLEKPQDQEHNNLDTHRYVLRWHKLCNWS